MVLPSGWMRGQLSEKRYAPKPREWTSATSSGKRRYESVAMSPVLPSAILPGRWVKVSQIDGPLPSASGDPSI